MIWRKSQHPFYLDWELCGTPLFSTLKGYFKARASNQNEKCREKSDMNAKRRHFVIHAQEFVYLWGLISIVPKPCKCVKYRNETINILINKVLIILEMYHSILRCNSTQSCTTLKWAVGYFKLISYRIALLKVRWVRHMKVLECPWFHLFVKKNLILLYTSYCVSALNPRVGRALSRVIGPEVWRRNGWRGAWEPSSAWWTGHLGLLSQFEHWQCRDPRGRRWLLGDRQWDGREGPQISLYSCHPVMLVANCVGKRFT